MQQPPQPHTGQLSTQLSRESRSLLQSASLTGSTTAVSTEQQPGGKLQPAHERPASLTGSPKAASPEQQPSEQSVPAEMRLPGRARHTGSRPISRTATDVTAHSSDEVTAGIKESPTVAALGDEVDHSRSATAVNQSVVDVQSAIHAQRSLANVSSLASSYTASFASLQSSRNGGLLDSAALQGQSHQLVDSDAEMLMPKAFVTDLSPALSPTVGGAESAEAESAEAEGAEAEVETAEFAEPGSAHAEPADASPSLVHEESAKPNEVSRELSKHTHAAKQGHSAQQAKQAGIKHAALAKLAARRDQAAGHALSHSTAEARALDAPSQAFPVEQDQAAGVLLSGNASSVSKQSHSNLDLPASVAQMQQQLAAVDGLANPAVQQGVMLSTAVHSSAAGYRATSAGRQLQSAASDKTALPANEQGATQPCSRHSSAAGSRASSASRQLEYAASDKLTHPAVQREAKQPPSRHSSAAGSRVSSATRHSEATAVGNTAETSVQDSPSRISRHSSAARIRTSSAQQDTVSSDSLPATGAANSATDSNGRCNHAAEAENGSLLRTAIEGADPRIRRQSSGVGFGVISGKGQQQTASTDSLPEIGAVKMISRQSSAARSRASSDKQLQQTTLTESLPEIGAIRAISRQSSAARSRASSGKRQQQIVSPESLPVMGASEDAVKAISRASSGKRQQHSILTESLPELGASQHAVKDIRRQNSAAGSRASSGRRQHQTASTDSLPTIAAAEDIHNPVRRQSSAARSRTSSGRQQQQIVSGEGLPEADASQATVRGVSRQSSAADFRANNGRQQPQAVSSEGLPEIGLSEDVVTGTSKHSSAAVSRASSGTRQQQGAPFKDLPETGAAETSRTQSSVSGSRASNGRQVLRLASTDSLPEIGTAEIVQHEVSRHSTAATSADASCLNSSQHIAVPSQQAQHSVDLAAPASSLKLLSSAALKLQQEEVSRETLEASLSQLGKEGGAGVVRHSVILGSAASQTLPISHGTLFPLDYDQLKIDIQVVHEHLGDLAGIAMLVSCPVEEEEQLYKRFVHKQC